MKKLIEQLRKKLAEIEEIKHQIEDIINRIEDEKWYTKERRNMADEEVKIEDSSEESGDKDE